jgi:hypothetical protein
LSQLTEPIQLQNGEPAAVSLLLPEPAATFGAKPAGLEPAIGAPSLPPILAGQFTAENRSRVEAFFLSVPQLLDTWVNRCRSPHTRRCYREDVLRFVDHLGLAWPEEAHRLLMTTVQDVQAYRDGLQARNAAPKSINRRTSSLSGFYKYVAAAAELRLPITIPNPAHAQFVGRSSSDPVDETRALNAGRAATDEFAQRRRRARRPRSRDFEALSLFRDPAGQRMPPSGGRLRAAGRGSCRAPARERR